MTRTIDRHIRVTPEQWERIENVARANGSTPNQLVVKLALEALDRREWPRSDHEVRLLRLTMFTARALARDMIAAGRAEEVRQIRRNISAMAPDPPEDAVDSDQKHASEVDSTAHELRPDLDKTPEGADEHA